MLIPDDRRYSPEHVWAQIDAGQATTGITDHAQDELGEIVYLDLPAAGSAVSRGVSMGEIESVKTVSDLIAPVSGTVVERNEAAMEKPGLVNADPYGAGWLVRVRVDQGAESEELISADEYRTLTEASG
jgi:glycine cleavage system H protein